MLTVTCGFPWLPIARIPFHPSCNTHYSLAPECHNPSLSITSNPTKFIQNLSPRILRLQCSSDSLRLQWVPVSSCLIFFFLPNHITPVSTSQVLGLKAHHPKWWNQGVSCFTFRLIHSHVVQGSHELRDPSACEFGSKVCTTSAWPLWLWLILHSDLQASFIWYLTNKISPHKTLKVPNIDTR